nr:Ig-like domain-containing protein [Rhodothalassium salexigens]
MPALGDDVPLAGLDGGDAADTDAGTPDTTVPDGEPSLSEIIVAEQGDDGGPDGTSGDDGGDPTNQAPTAGPLSLTATEDGDPVSAALPVTDPDADDTLGYEIVTDPAEGSASVDPDGTVRFDPGDGFQDLAEGDSRDVAFTYRVTDSAGNTATETVTVTVTGTNDAPLAAADTGTTGENIPLTLDVLTNDRDPDAGDTLTLTGASLAPGAGGSVSITDDGRLAFDPGSAYDHLAPGDTATATVTYTVTDEASATDTATATITVTGTNDAPVATFTGPVAAEEDGPTVSGQLTATDVDAEPGELRYALVEGPAEGSVTVDPDGGFAFDAGDDFQDLAEGQTRDVSFTYKVTDGHGGSDTETVTITVTGTNDAPIAVADTATTGENAPLTLDVLTNDRDPDADDTLTLTGATLAPGAGGSVSITDDGRLAFDPGSAYDHLAPGDTATATVTYTVTDDTGATDTATATITVTGTNDAPLATFTGPVAAEEDGPTVSGQLTATDVDAETGELRYALVEGPAEGSVTVDADGGFAFDAGEDFQDLAEGQTRDVSFTYKVTDGHGGSDTETVTITVTGTNDAPIAAADTGTTGENSPLTLDVLANDRDPDADDTLTLTGATLAPGAGSSVSITDDGRLAFDPGSAYDHLAPGDTATATVTYTVTDDAGATDTATATITITGTNDAPVAMADTGATDEDSAVDVDVLANDRDADAGDGATLTDVAWVDGQAGRDGSSIDIVDGALRFDPGDAYNDLSVGDSETVQVRYTVTDDHGASDTATATITIAGRNDAPAITAVTQDGGAVDGALLLNETGRLDGVAMIADVDNFPTNALTVSMTFASDTPPGHDGLNTNGNALFSYNGSDGDDNEFMVFARPNGRFSVYVNGQECDLGRGIDNAFGDLFDGQPHDLTVSWDSTDGSLRVYLDGQLAGEGTVSTGQPISAGGTVTLGQEQTDLGAGFDREQDFNGRMYGLTVRDGALTPDQIAGGDDRQGRVLDFDFTRGEAVGLTNQVTGETKMTIAQDALFVGGQIFSAVEDGDAIAIQVTAQDPDRADTLRYRLNERGADAEGVATIDPATGRIVFDPADDFQYLAEGETTTVTLTVTVDDGRDLPNSTDTETVTITVTGTNDAPIVDVGPGAASEDGAPVTIAVDARDVDNDDSVSLAVLDQPEAGQVTLDADGQFVFDPGHAFQDLDTGDTRQVSFRYRATDAMGETTTGTATVTVTGADDQPVIGPIVDVTNSLDAQPVLPGQALTLDGAAGDAALAADLAGWPGDALTVSMTFASAAAPGSGGRGDVALLSYAVEGSDNAFTVLANDHGGLDVYVNNQLVRVPVDGGTGALFDGTYKTLSLSWDGDTGALRVYVDSEFKGEGLAAAGQTVPSGGTLALGQDQDSVGGGFDPDQAFTGRIADLQLFDHVRGAATLAADAGQAGVDGATGGSVLAYDFTDGGLDDRSGGADLSLDGGAALTGDAALDRPGETPLRIGEDANALRAIGGRITASDIDGDDLSFSLVEGPAQGALTLASDGQFTYHPDGAFESLGLGDTATVRFTVAVSDGDGPAVTREVSLIIEGENDAPTDITLSPDAGQTGTDPAQDRATVAENAAAGTVVATLGSVDVDAGDSHTYALVEQTRPLDEALAADPDGVFSLPTGADGLRLTAMGRLEDGDGQATHSVWRLRNGTDEAVEVTLSPYGGGEPITVTLPPNTDTFVASEAAGATHKMSWDGGAQTKAPGGGGFSYDAPVTVGAGDLPFEVVGDQLRVRDGANLDYETQSSYQVTLRTTDEAGATHTETITVDLTDRPEAPTAGPLSLTATEDGDPVSAALPVTDPDADDTLGYEIVTDPAEGSASVDPDGTVRFDPSDGFQDLAEGDSRDVTFTYRVTDSAGNAATETVTVTVTGTNDAPLAAADTGTTGENIPLTLDVLANDRDPDADDTLTLTGATLAPGAGGSVSITDDGRLAFDPGNAYDHLAPGDTATATVTYTVTDDAGATDTATATITVTGTNDAPVATFTGPVAAEEDGPTVSGQLTATDVDAETGELRYALVEGPGEGSVTVDPDGGFAFDAGDDFQDLAEGQTRDVSFTYKVTDGHGGTDTETVTITVTGTNDAPVGTYSGTLEADEDGSLVDGQLTATDVDGPDDKIVFDLVSDPEAGGGWVTVLPDGRFGFDPGEDFQELAEGETRDVTFTYKVTDEHGATSTATATITVTGRNDAPIATFKGPVTAEEDGPVVSGQLTAYDVDADPGDLSFALVDEPAEGSVSVDPDGTFRFDPGNDFQDLAEGETRDVSFTYKVTDEQGATSTASVTVTVTGTADAPAAIFTTGDDTVDLTAYSASVAAAATQRDALSGNDTVILHGGVDYGADSAFDAGTGDDRVTGTARADHIHGGAGHDTLIGAGGGDVLTGGAGNDRFEVAPGDGAVVITDFTPVGSGGTLQNAGFDTIRFGAGLRPEAMQMVQDGADTVITFDNAPGLSVRLEGVDVTLLDDLPGGHANFLFDGSTAAGDAGPDAVDVFNPYDDARGGLFSGDTVTFLTPEDNDVTGTRSADVIKGMGGDDRIDGGGGDDTLEGNAGDDTLIGGAGDDMLRGGLGDDTLTGSGSGGGGGDRNVFALGDVSARHEGDDVITDFDVNGGGETGFDTLTFRFDGQDYALQTSEQFLDFINEITTDGRDDTSARVDGADLVFDFGATVGSVRLEGVVGPDGLDPDDIDAILTPDQPDPGDDTEDDGPCGETRPGDMLGTEGTDTLTGTPGSDRIFGLGGDDVIRDSGNGDDVICGGDGRDIIQVSGRGDDRIGGGDGDDIIDNAGSGHDQIWGGAGDDIIRNSGNGNDQIRGGAGNDEITSSGNGDDQFWGGDGDDVITRKGAGDDQFWGGAGNDTMTGGAGDDTFHIDDYTGTAPGHDTVTDFRPGTDTIDIAGYGKVSSGVQLLGFIASLAVSGRAGAGARVDGDDLVIDYGDGAGSLTLAGVVGQDGLTAAAIDDAAMPAGTSTANGAAADGLSARGAGPVPDGQSAEAATGGGSTASGATDGTEGNAEGPAEAIQPDAPADASDPMQPANATENAAPSDAEAGPEAAEAAAGTGDDQTATAPEATPADEPATDEPAANAGPSGDAAGTGPLDDLSADAADAGTDPGADPMAGADGDDQAEPQGAGDLSGDDDTPLSDVGDAAGETTDGAADIGAPTVITVAGQASVAGTGDDELFQVGADAAFNGVSYLDGGGGEDTMDISAFAGSNWVISLDNGATFSADGGTSLTDIDSPGEIQVDGETVIDFSNIDHITW